MRINGVVHLKSYLGMGETGPIGWIAVGNPAEVLPPGEHDRIREIQQPLDFPLTVYGLERSEATMQKITRRLSGVLPPTAGDRRFSCQPIWRTSLHRCCSKCLGRMVGQCHRLPDIGRD